MKKLLSVTLAATMALGAVAGLAACGDNKKKSDDSVIKVWAPSAAIECYEALAAEFLQGEYEGGKYADKFTVEFEAVAEGEVETKLSTDASTGADVFFFEQGQITNMFNKNLLQPLGASITSEIVARDSETWYSSIMKEGVAYAYPTTGDNGWFLWYDSAIYSEEDVKSLDTMMTKAAAANKHIMFDYGNGWYMPSFAMGLGCTMDYNAEGEYTTDVDGANGLKAAQAAYKYLTQQTAGGKAVMVKPSSDMNSEIPAGLKSGTLAAGFIGTWVAADMPSTAKAAKAPTFTVDGDTTAYQMGSFMGGKYCGVNPQRNKVNVSIALANYFTNEAGQAARFEATSAGPTNEAVVASEEVTANEAISALIAQNDAGGYAQLRQSSGFWDAWAAFGNGIATGETKEAGLQTALNNLVAAMKA